MKLILCTKCHDVFKLDVVDRSCKCGACTGRYLKNEIDARYQGEHAVPLGFNNTLLAKAIKLQPEKGMGRVFEAFVIPKNCPTFIKIIPD